ncbi:MAG: ABC transporter permease, partial [Chloroflexota bacterium]
FPGIAILVLVVAINVLGEGLRDILDPRLKVE